MRFLAEEALDEALRCYRESRELGVDLVADGGDDREESDQGIDDGGASRSNAAGGLLRAEFNLGMALVEQKNHGDAIEHLLAVGDWFRQLVRSTSDTAAAETAGGGLGRGDAAQGHAPGEARQGREGETRRIEGAGTSSSSLSYEKTFLLLGEGGSSELGGLYASSLALLGECWASATPPPFAASSSCSTSKIPNPAPTSNHERQKRARAVDGADDEDNVVRTRASPQVPQVPKPLGALPGASPVRLNAAVDALEAAVGAFLALGDPAGALDPLERLARILRLNGGERYFVRVETLCIRASRALLPADIGGTGKHRHRKSHGEERKAGADIDDEEEDQAKKEEGDEEEGIEREIENVREEIEELRRRWNVDGGTKDGRGKSRGCSPHQKAQQGSAGASGGSSGGGGNRGDNAETGAVVSSPHDRGNNRNPQSSSPSSSPEKTRGHSGAADDSGTMFVGGTYRAAADSNTSALDNATLSSSGGSYLRVGPVGSATAFARRRRARAVLATTAPVTLGGRGRGVGRGRGGHDGRCGTHATVNGASGGRRGVLGGCTRNGGSGGRQRVGSDSQLLVGPGTSSSSSPPLGSSSVTTVAPGEVPNIASFATLRSAAAAAASGARVLGDGSGPTGDEEGAQVGRATLAAYRNTVRFHVAVPFAEVLPSRYTSV